MPPPTLAAAGGLVKLVCAASGVLGGVNWARRRSARCRRSSASKWSGRPATTSTRPSTSRAAPATPTSSTRRRRRRARLPRAASPAGRGAHPVRRSRSSRRSGWLAASCEAVAPRSITCAAAGTASRARAASGLVEVGAQRCARRVRRRPARPLSTPPQHRTVDAGVDSPPPDSEEESTAAAPPPPPPPCPPPPLATATPTTRRRGGWRSTERPRIDTRRYSVPPRPSSRTTRQRSTERHACGWRLAPGPRARRHAASRRRDWPRGWREVPDTCAGVALEAARQRVAARGLRGGRRQQIRAERAAHVARIGVARLARRAPRPRVHRMSVGTPPLVPAMREDASAPSARRARSRRPASSSSRSRRGST